MTPEPGQPGTDKRRLQKYFILPYPTAGLRASEKTVRLTALQSGPVADDPDSDSGALPNSLELLYEQKRGMLRNLFEQRVRQAQVVDDLMQDLYVLVHKNRFRQGIEEPTLYLLQMAYNVLRTHQRKTRREQRRRVVLNWEEFDSPTQHAESLRLEDDSTSALVDEELGQVLEDMPLRWAYALVRYRWNHCTYQQIANELGVSVHTAKKYLKKAMNRLQQHLDHDNRDP